jgi:hypothetical protein
MQSQNHEALFSPPASTPSAFSQQPSSINFEWDENTVDDGQSGIQAADGAVQAGEPSAKGYLGDTSTITFLWGLMGKEQQNAPPRSDESPSSGTPNPRQIRNSSSSFDSRLAMWPQRFLADHLVDCYMEFCYPQYPFIHGPTFRRRYEAIWTSKEPQNNLLAGTVNLVFALGCQFSPKISPKMGQDFFQNAKSLLVFDLFGSGNLDTLQALVLMGLYLQCSKSPNHSWNVIGLAVRLAQSLGLHLNKTIQNSKTLLQREVRKRVWWGCFVLDSVSSLMLGRPQVVSGNPFTVERPDRMDDELISDHPECMVAQGELPGADDQPAMMDFFLATIEMCRFMHKVLKAHDGEYTPSEILEIDHDLCEWFAKLPRHLNHEESASADKKLWRQKEVLTSRYV